MEVMGALIRKTRFRKSLQENVDVPAQMLRDFQAKTGLSDAKLRDLAGFSAKSGKRRIYQAKLPKGYRNSRPLSNHRFFQMAFEAGHFDVAKRLWSQLGAYRSAELADSITAR